MNANIGKREAPCTRRHPSKSSPWRNRSLTDVIPDRFTHYQKLSPIIFVLTLVTTKIGSMRKWSVTGRSNGMYRSRNMSPNHVHSKPCPSSMTENGVPSDGIIVKEPSECPSYESMRRGTSSDELLYHEKEVVGHGAVNGHVVTRRSRGAA